MKHVPALMQPFVSPARDELVIWTVNRRRCLDPADVRYNPGNPTPPVPDWCEDELVASHQLIREKVEARFWRTPVPDTYFENLPGEMAIAIAAESSGDEAMEDDAESGSGGDSEDARADEPDDSPDNFALGADEQAGNGDEGQDAEQASSEPQPDGDELVVMDEHDEDVASEHGPDPVPVVPSPAARVEPIAGTDPKGEQQELDDDGDHVMRDAPPSGKS